jgi:release factor glutamine methyltransferase
VASGRAVRLEDLTTVIAAGDTERRLDPLDPARVRSDPVGSAALEALVGRLRCGGAALGDDTEDPLVAMAMGDEAEKRVVDDLLGGQTVAALAECGALDIAGPRVRLTARLFVTGAIYTLLPFNRDDLDTVYLGPDSIVFFEVIWAARGYGDRAVDLGTGNGFIAAALATRYDHVVAADLSPRCAATAGLVPLLNPQLRGRFSAARTDVADGLRLGSFDLVTANAPWVPETLPPHGAPARIFAAGGPSGFELPRRFIDGAADLLAPGGRAFIACMALDFDDGRRPLDDHLEVVRGRGFDAYATATRANQMFDYPAWAARKVSGAISARHVVVEVRRPR